MIVQVKLFATLRRYYPHLAIGESMTVELPDDAAIAQLVEHLRLPTDQIKMIFVNARLQEWDYELQDGDEVGIFPPIGGG
jgi:molybdopterin converting factor small subunit